MRTLARMNAIIASVWSELFQTERSAERHPAVEAERLGDIPPATPLRLVSAHATNALARLKLLAEARGYEADELGRGVGGVLSQWREKAADLLLTNETSYRGTLAGIRHGVDLMSLVHHAAETDEELRAFTTEWLEERRQLATAAERELRWFARNPAVALAPVADSVLARAAKVLTRRSEPAPRA